MPVLAIALLVSTPIAAADGSAAFPSKGRSSDTGPLWAIARDAVLTDSQTTTLRALQHLEDAHLLATIAAEPFPDPLTRTVTLAKVATFTQGTELGLDMTEPLPYVPRDASPSAALVTLVAEQGGSMNASQLANLAPLDSLPSAERDALTNVIDAYVAFDAASRYAYAHADVVRLSALLDDPTLTSPGAALRAAGVDAGPVFTARNGLLDAALKLRHVVYPPNSISAASCDELLDRFRVLNYFALSMTSCNDQYGSSDPSDICGYYDFSFLLDLGGDDTYYNNAGGYPSDHGSSARCSSQCSISGTYLESFYAAALIDLGGNDRYVSRRSCGINGGTASSAEYNGFLFDAGGDDVYAAGSHGTNGGSAQSGGFGFLLDAGGRDSFTAGNDGTNGGASSDGIGGLLVEGMGDTSYSGGDHGVNGGNDGGQSSLLIDSGGNDYYTAGSYGTNGGSSILLAGLLDLGGNDVYSARNYGTNGGCSPGGGLSAFLIDAAGNDQYRAGSGGVNGGSFDGGSPCLLLDGGGSDSYSDNEGGTGTDRTVLLKDGEGNQIDVQPTTAPQPPVVNPQEISFGVPGGSTPAVPSESTTVGPVDFPGSCPVSACSRPTTVSGEYLGETPALPGVPTPPVSTPSVCVPNPSSSGNCVIDQPPVGILPSVPLVPPVPSQCVCTPPVTLDPLCETLGSICIGSNTLVPAKTLGPTPGLDPVAYPGASVAITLTGLAFGVDPHQGESEFIGPITLPTGGVVCPTPQPGCMLPVPPEATIDVLVTVTVKVGSQSTSVSEPVDKDIGGSVP